MQKELDRVEEYVLNKLFGDIQNPKISTKIKTILAIKGINFDDFINKKIEIFESYMKDFMREDGFLDVEKIEKVVSIQYPNLEGLKLPVARPIEYVKMLEKFISLDSLAEMIENF